MIPYARNAARPVALQPHGDQGFMSGGSLPTVGGELSHHLLM
jgi:hypothetical protein